MKTITLTDKEANFLERYLDTAFWVADIEPQELDEDSHREATIDCLAFLSRVDWCLKDDNRKQAAHDFYLSRNGHGSGFFSWPKTYTSGWDADQLQAIAESFGPTDYYTTDGELLT
jgi:hypothetical protein